MSLDSPAPASSGGAGERPSRAGRNLPVAIVVGIGLGALVIACLFWRKELFLVLATVSVSYGTWEIVSAMRARGRAVPALPAVLGCVAQMVAAYFGGTAALAVAFLLTGALVVMWRGAEGVERAASDVTGGFLVAAYPALLGGIAMLMLAAADGAWRAFTFVAVTVASDVGGYAVGVLFGKHPIAPAISPKKSWEGFAGSVLLCMIAGAMCVVWGLHGPWWAGVILGALMAPAATIGDFAESAIKRDLGVKDMSSLLPGHGGLMDRLDSLVVAAPVAWVVMALLVPEVRG